MFEFYQVDKITCRFIPYKWELASSVTGVNLCNARPTYSIIDPLLDSPTTPSGFLSYGNALVTKPYAENTRHINYMDLAIQKQ